MTLEEATTNDSLHLIKWTRGLKRKLLRRNSQMLGFDSARLAYRSPTGHLSRQWLHFDPLYIEHDLWRVPAMFPTGATPNQAHC